MSAMDNLSVYITSPCPRASANGQARISMQASAKYARSIESAADRIAEPITDPVTTLCSRGFIVNCTSGLRHVEDSVHFVEVDNKTHTE